MVSILQTPGKVNSEIGKSKKREACPLPVFRFLFYITSVELPSFLTISNLQSKP